MMRQSVFVFVAIGAASFVASRPTNAQVNDSCSNPGSGNFCLNASQTGTGAGEALKANCDNVGECVEINNSDTSTGTAAAITSNSANATSLLVNNGSTGSGVWAIVDQYNMTYTSGNGIAVLGGTAASGGSGIYGVADGSSANGVVGIYGTASLNSSYSTSGVYGASSSADGVTGTSSASTASGVAGINTATSGGFGVYGTGYGAGIYGTVGSSDASDASAVYGQATDTGGQLGVAGRILPYGSGYAVYGDNTSSSGYAGYFTGVLYYKTLAAGSSDIRLKKNVQPLSGAIDRLLQLKGVTFEWKDPSVQGQQTGTQQGFIAQEVEKVMPQWIGPNDAQGFKTIAIPGHALDALVVESIRTLKTENDSLRAETQRLEERVQLLETGGRHHLAAGVLDDRDCLFVGLGVAFTAASAFGSRRRRAASAGNEP